MKTEDIKKQSLEIFGYLFEMTSPGRRITEGEDIELRIACVKATSTMMAAQIHVVGILEFENKLNKLLDALEKTL